MSQKTNRIVVVFSLMVLCVGCAPETRTKVKMKTPSGEQDSSYSGGYRRPATKTTTKNYTKIEKQIPNLESRTSKALTLIEQAYDLKKKYDNETGAARTRLGEQIGEVYQKAGDVYDEILMDVDEIQEREGIKDDLLMRRGRVLSNFARLWEKRSKPIKRMSFHK